MLRQTHSTGWRCAENWSETKNALTFQRRLRRQSKEAPRAAAAAGAGEGMGIRHSPWRGGRGAAGTCERLRRGSPGAGGRLGLPELQQKVCGEGEGTDESPRLPGAGAHAHPISHH